MSKIAILDEFFEKNDRNTNSDSCIPHELRFTGNWFIDAGILGFVNLVEEVYGWDLDELQRRIKENPELVYYGYFPLAYMFIRSIISGIYKQQKALRDLTQKAIEKISKIWKKIEKNRKKLEQERSSKKSSKIRDEIEELKRQIEELEKVISEIDEHISLLNEELPKLKIEFKKRVENVLRDYKKFTDQYNEYFATAEWIDKILPKDKTSKLNERLIKILDKAVILKLLRKSKSKNEVESILGLLPANGNFNIHANANERNFYLYNPIKKDEYTVLLYLMALLHEDIGKIKLLLGIKYDQKNPHSLREKISTFLELCKQYSLDPVEILNYIEDSVNSGTSKKKAVESLLKKCKVPQSSKKELEEFLSNIYKNFKDLIGRRGQLITYEVIPDSTINPFLFSPGEFPNINYTSLPTTKDIKKLLLNNFPPYILYLTFFDAFLPVYGKAIMFYMPELGSCYSINKKIKIKMEVAKKGNRGNLNLLRITWSAIIDELVETKSRFSLENMYLIEANLDRNKLSYVEYIGVQKLHASIILDDIIRDALNSHLPVGIKRNSINKPKQELKSGDFDNVWILEKFISQEPLLPIVLKHLHLYLFINKEVYQKTCLYALVVDAKIREFGKDNRVFGVNFFNSYRGLLSEIKDDARWCFRVSNMFRELTGDQDEREKYANLLLLAIRRNNKYRFVNTLLKLFTEKKDNKNIRGLVNFAFSRVLSNDLSWKNYALVFILGLISGGGE